MGLSGSRLRLHILLAFVNLSILATVWVVVDPAEALDRLSLVSAYLFLLLISFVLLVGPVRAVRTGRVTINHTLRRDVAIWSALMGLVHLVAGAAESMTPVYLEAFVTHAVNPPSATMREAFFFWSAIVGFIIGLLLLVLLALSNNWSMTLIGQRWWKRLHRLSYIIFALTILHGLGFQVLESRWWVGYGLVGALAFGVCIAQVSGIRAIVKRPGR